MGSLEDQMVKVMADVAQDPKLGYIVLLRRNSAPWCGSSGNQSESLGEELSKTWDFEGVVVALRGSASKLGVNAVHRS